GAIKNWVKLQDSYESIFCVVDMHAITIPQDPKALRKKTIEAAKIYLAAGIDPQKSVIFIQSHVKEHAELTWILNTVAKMPDLDKMTQFKDKTQKGGRESAGVGLFDYPVLMAADILLYDTEVVPVGEDQVQHVELTRTLGRKFNNKFGETFVIPEPKLVKEAARIMGLDDPTKKMSKSAASEYNYIGLLDDAETVRRKIKKAVTDSGSEIVYSDDKPALKNLINIFSAFSEKSPKEIEKMYVDKGYADFKSDLAEEIIKFLEPFQKRYNELSDEEVLNILKDGAEKVRSLAKKKMDEVKQRIGFII
ncbi:MAG: tryptophan--tRNA ligase, partial [Candidatus Moranbacteria bacterium]|nr:tryptophan--tRNA ligase [Candidatus Moranbacteria bacterium]